MLTFGTLLPWIGLFAPVSVAIVVLLVRARRQTDDHVTHERSFRP